MSHTGWIVTLDVLKYKHSEYKCSCSLLNSNIRCIEISIISKAMKKADGWIVTLDVLKYDETQTPTAFDVVE